MAVHKSEIIEWLKGLPGESFVGIADDAMRLMVVGNKDEWFEIGAIPISRETKVQDVVETLKFGAMPFLELAGSCNLGHEELQDILKELKAKKIVKITHPKDLIKQIVTLN